jgi:hypothetical protein
VLSLAHPFTAEAVRHSDVGWSPDDAGWQSRRSYVIAWSRACASVRSPLPRRSEPIARFPRASATSPRRRSAAAERLPGTDPVRLSHDLRAALVPPSLADPPQQSALGVRPVTRAAGSREPGRNGIRRRRRLLPFGSWRGSRLPEVGLHRGRGATAAGPPTWRRRLARTDVGRSRRRGQVPVRRDPELVAVSQILCGQPAYATARLTVMSCGSVWRLVPSRTTARHTSGLHPVPTLGFHGQTLRRANGRSTFRRAIGGSGCAAESPMWVTCRSSKQSGPGDASRAGEEGAGAADLMAQDG